MIDEGGLGTIIRNYPQTGERTFDFSLGASECGGCWVGEVLERSVGVFEERLSGSPGQRACLEESLLLFLMFVDELGYQGSSVVITGLSVPEKWWAVKQSIFFIFNRNLEHIY